MIVARGKKHYFLGMMITFHDNELLQINMKACIKIVTQDFGEEEEKLKPASTPERSFFPMHRNHLN